jgi:hypothetical protein
VEAYRVLRRRGSHIYFTDGGEVVRLTRWRPPFNPNKIAGAHFYHRLSRPQGHRATIMIRWNEKINSMFLSGIDPATIRLVVQCFNQLCNSVPKHVCGSSRMFWYLILSSLVNPVPSLKNLISAAWLMFSSFRLLVLGSIHTTMLVLNSLKTNITGISVRVFPLIGLRTVPQIAWQRRSSMLHSCHTLVPTHAPLLLLQYYEYDHNIHFWSSDDVKVCTHKRSKQPTDCFKNRFTMIFQMLLCGECYENVYT